VNVERIQAELRAFARDREWEQFHTPKNLAMALSVETCELMEIFQWLTAEESTTVMAGDAAGPVRDEVADVLIYLLRLADVLGVDLEQAVEDKLRSNAARYPVGSARGSAAKAPRDTPC
jgi:NTP pyrophosphatase (non-canonical NTP hydrolase)